MNVDSLIEKLLEIKKEFGNLEIIINDTEYGYSNLECAEVIDYFEPTSETPYKVVELVK